MSDRGIKVTDRRMFTADGEVREEFRDEVASAGDGVSAAAAAPEAELPPPAPEVAEAPVEPERLAPPEPERRAPPLEIPGSPPGLGPTFYDLIGLLADPIPLYLGDASLPDGRKVENLEMARLHIDLLDLLRQKTVGNLTSQELAVLEDFLYRARLRFVQKRG